MAVYKNVKYLSLPQQVNKNKNDIVSFQAIQNADASAGEIIAGRDGEIDLITKINKIDAKFFEIATVYASDYKTNLNDWGQAITDAVDFLSISGGDTLGGKILLPSGLLLSDHPIILQSYITIEGQGTNKTILSFSGCKGITCTGTYLQYINLKNFRIKGDNNRVLTSYDATKHGIDFSGCTEMCASNIDNIFITEFAGEGIYIPVISFSCNFNKIITSYISGNAINLWGGNTLLLTNCMILQVGVDKCGYKIARNATLINCNGMAIGSSYWGIFGHNTALDGTNQYASVHLISCNIEEFTKNGITIRNGYADFSNCAFVATGSQANFDYYVEILTTVGNKIITFDSGCTFGTNGATSNFTQMVKLVYFDSTKIMNYSSVDITVGSGASVANAPRLYISYPTSLTIAMQLSEVVIESMEYYHLGNKKHAYGTVAPTTRTWAVGDTVHKTNPSLGSNIGWVCITAGTPGTWEVFGIAGAIKIVTQADSTASDLAELIVDFNLLLGKLKTAKIMS